MKFDEIKQSQTHHLAPSKLSGKQRSICILIRPQSDHLLIGSVVFECGFSSQVHFRPLSRHIWANPLPPAHGSRRPHHLRDGASAVADYESAKFTSWIREPAT